MKRKIQNYILHYRIAIQKEMKKVRKRTSSKLWSSVEQREIDEITTKDLKIRWRDEFFKRIGTKRGGMITENNLRR
jgi:hypothetical protein